MSALAGARAARQINLPLAHIEAGLRSHDRENPYPEEDIRVGITQLADWHYAPTSTAVQNLKADGVPEGRIYLTGNTVVSALERYATLKHCPSHESRVLITMHRREWLNQGHFHILSTFDALFDSASQHPDLQFVWLIHPSLRLALGGDLPAAPPNVHLFDPFPYRDTVELLRTATGCITDSGGLQEEAATLGVPCVVLRHVSDRPESITEGIAQLLPPTPQGMTSAVPTLLALPRRPSQCYGSPNAANLVANHLASLT